MARLASTTLAVYIIRPPTPLKETTIPVLQKFRRKVALLALDARPRARVLRLIVFMVVVVIGAVAVSASVRFTMLRAEVRAMKCYLKTLEAFQAKRAMHLGQLTTERDLLSWRSQHGEELTQLSVRVGMLAARGSARLSEAESMEIAEAALVSAYRHGLPPRLVLGVIMTESRFDRFAASSQGALGLMQLMPSTAQGLARELRMPLEIPAGLYEVRTNIELGTCYLAKLVRSERSLARALSAYNTGPAAGKGIQMAFVGSVSRHAGLEISRTP